MKKLLLLIVLIMLAGCSNKQKLSVSFDTDGGSKVQTIGVFENDKIEKPSEPIKEGYDFVGWMKDGELFDFDMPLTSDTVLVAKWEKSKVNVTFDVNGEILTDEVLWGEVIDFPADPISEDGAFLYWEKDGKKYEANKVVKKDITLTAKFMPYSKSISYIANSSNTGYLVSGYEYEESLIIPSVHNGLPVIGFTSDFKGHAETEILYMPDSIKAIASFNNMVGLEYVKMSNSLTEIPAYCFSGCESLKTVVFSNELKTIGEAAFYQCYSLKEVNLPSGLVEIGMLAFAACVELQNVKIPSNIKVISAAVFAECYKLSAVELPSCSEKIEYSAFQNCFSLESIVIPIGVKEIGMIAFYGCENIKVYCEASSPLEGWANNWNVVDSKTGKTIEAFWGYKK